MNVELIKEFRFEAAHRLPKVQKGHRCERLHGHSFKIEVAVRGAVDEATGFLLDYAALDEAMAPLLARLDHYYLNEIDGLENPTSEVLAGWLWTRLRPLLPELSQVIVHETCDARCVYRGD